MQSTSALYKSIYAGSHYQEPKIDVYTSDGQTLVATFGTDKLISLSTTRALFNKEDFCIGACVSGEIDVRFYPTDANGDAVTIPRMAMIKAFIRLVSDDETQQSEWLPKGVFFVDTRQVDKTSGIMEIHGYDAMLKTEVLFPSTTGQDFPMTDHDLVILVASLFGVSVDARTFEIILDPTPNPIYIGLPVGYSLREVLSYIAVPYCGNWCITDEGKLLLVSAVVDPITNGVLVDNVSGLPITIGGVHIIV